MSETQEPKILSSPDTGRYSFVTKYKTAGMGFKALEKVDITEQLQQLLVKERLDELEHLGFDLRLENPILSCYDEQDFGATTLDERKQQLKSQLNKEKSV